LPRRSEFVNIIDHLRRIQVAFTLGEDDVLVEGIKRFIDLRNGKGPTFVSAGYLWETITQFDRTFALQYKTSNSLARKLVTMEPNLQALFKIEHEYDNSRGIRTWKFEKR
jgi:hypothetical protein